VQSQIIEKKAIFIEQPKNIDRLEQL